MTQKQAVLQYVKDFGSISSMEAFGDLGVTRLADVVYKLKKDGYTVKSTTESTVNRYGNKVNFSRYVIEGGLLI